MAQQTINVGTAPNDGTGTPLRTAFQYTNSNFSELYTAVGPSGNNIVVPGNATITGDLTVDTSTLKVDSVNNRVGIRTASPAEPLTVDNSSGVTTGAIRIYATDQSHSRLSIQNGNGQAYHLVAGNPGASNAGFALYDNTAAATRLWVDNTGVHTWQNVGGVAGTAMTLNATGLGIGLAPVGGVKLSVAGTIYANAGNALILDNPSSNFVAQIKNTGSSLQSTLAFLTGSGTSMLIDNSGNVGIGVTPSAWAAGYKAIQIAASQSTALMGSGNQTELTTNAFFDGAWKYQGAGTVAASRYSQQSGVHYWYTAAAGAAGTAIGSGFSTAAMTLDASGNLLVGTTSNGITNTNSHNLSKSGYIGVSHASTPSGDYYLAFGYNGSIIGSITQNGTTGVLYNITSDYRLKEQVQPLVGGLARVNALKPSVYKWKSDGSNGEGFLAHELAEVVPFAVSGEKDAVNEDGSIKSQGIDMSRVVPILVAAIQELTARVQTLETR